MRERGWDRAGSILVYDEGERRGRAGWMRECDEREGRWSGCIDGGSRMRERGGDGA